MYEIAFENSTQDSSEKEIENRPSLTKRIPLKSREKSSSCYKRLTFVGRKKVIE